MWVSHASSIAIIFVSVVYMCEDCGYYDKKWYRAMHWCRYDFKTLHTGDFNGDGQTDLLCHDKKGLLWTAYAQEDGSFTRTQWFSGEYTFCSDATSLYTKTNLHIGDFNGDGRSDIMCHCETRGHVKIALATPAGTFKGVQWQEGLGFCLGGKVLIGDYNGDKKADMLCHQVENGFVQVAYTQRRVGFSGVNWQLAMFWCRHVNSRVYVGDFNGDGLSDMLCSHSEGEKWILYANADPQNLFTRDGFNAKISACLEQGASSFIRIGDVNGDKKDDLICHSAAGTTTVCLTHRNRRFVRHPATISSCKFNETGFYAGYFNKDNRIDIMCHDQLGGDKTIKYAECPDIDA